MENGGTPFQTVYFLKTPHSKELLLVMLFHHPNVKIELLGANIIF